MKVALISKAGRAGGGASQVAEDLHTAFSSQPDLQVESSRFVGQLNAPVIPSTGNHERPLYRANGKWTPLWAEAWLSSRGLADALPLRWLSVTPELKQLQLLHFHDLSSIAAPLDLVMLVRRRPVVWTMHDLSPLTGGCLYPLGCSTYLRGCGSCPQLGQWPLPAGRDLTALTSRLRQMALRSRRVRLVSPSQWLAREVQRLVPDRPVEVIPNGVCHHTFSPTPKPAHPSRGEGPLRLLFVANYLNEPRKGGLYLPELVRWFNQHQFPVELILIGHSPLGANREQFGSVVIQHRSRIADPYVLAQMYGEADALLMLSHADNCPLVVLEAMACGLPVVSWDTGGIPELVDEHCGLIVPQGDLQQLLTGLVGCARSGLLPSMGVAARVRVLRFFTRERMAADYARVYNHLLKGNPQQLA